MLISLFIFGVIIINLEIWMPFPLQRVYVIHNQEYIHWNSEALQEGFSFTILLSS